MINNESCRRNNNKIKRKMQIFLCTLSIFSLITAVSIAQESETRNLCTNGCKNKVEYCEEYESKCQLCETICLPPTNQKFTECGKKCSAFLQDILIEHYNEPKHQVHLDTVEALLVLVTCISIITLVVLTVLVVLKAIEKFGSKIRAKTEIMPMYHVESSTIRTLSTGVQESSGAISSRRIPIEDRAPSESGYDNPVMVPSPSHH